MQINYSEIKDKTKIVDIRTSLEFDKNNIKGSINVPKLKLLKNPENYLNKQDDYYLLCNEGKVSSSCTNILNALGYRCYSIIGGMDGLKEK